MSTHFDSAYPDEGYDSVKSTDGASGYREELASDAAERRACWDDIRRTERRDTVLIVRPRP
jgi:hypothetical protein